MLFDVFLPKGLHRSKEGHRQNVRDEVHEQVRLREEGRRSERFLRGGPPPAARPPVPRQPLVHVPGRGGHVHRRRSAARRRPALSHAARGRLRRRARQTLHLRDGAGSRVPASTASPSPVGRYIVGT